MLASPLIAEPFHLLDCATTSEGGCALVLTGSRRGPWTTTRRSGSWAVAATATALRTPWRRCGTTPLGRAASRRGGSGPTPQQPPSPWRGSGPRTWTWRSSTTPSPSRSSGSSRPTVSASRVREGRWSSRAPSAPEGASRSPPTAAPCPSATPGSRPSSSSGWPVGVRQLRGECPSMQVAGAEVALCSNGGSGALFTDVMLLGKYPAVSTTADAHARPPAARHSPPGAVRSFPAVLGSGAGRAGWCCPCAPAAARAPCGRSPPAPSATRRTLGWEPSGGRGSLYSWTVVWRPPHPVVRRALRARGRSRSTRGGGS